MAIQRNIVQIPALVDLHVHFREPGFSYKETIRTGSMAAAASGYSAVFTMPNLNPVPDSYENLKQQLDIINDDAKIKVLPFGSITRGEMGLALSDIEALATYVCGFSDDGRGVQSEDMMREATPNEIGTALGTIIVLRSQFYHVPDGEPEDKKGTEGKNS